MILIYDLLTRAADTAEDSWMDRFSAMTYDDLLDSYGMTPTDAQKQAAKDFEDDARILLYNWDSFRKLLLEADDSVDAINKMEELDVDAAVEKTKAIRNDSSTREVIKALSDVVDVQIEQARMIELASAITLADYLENIDYGDGTMLDFFTRSKSTMEKNIKELYPLVAALSEGQRAGLEFVSLQEFVMISNRETEYSQENLKDIVTTSVYDGVDRGIYQKGGVALTWDAKRTEALEAEKNAADRRMFSTKTIVLWALTGISAVAFIGSMANLGVKAGRYLMANIKLYSLNKKLDKIYNDCFDSIDNGTFMDAILDEGTSIDAGTNATELENKLIPKQKDLIVKLAAPTKTAAWMSAGFTVALVIIAAITTYMTWRDLKAYYDVDYAVIPHYMVDETAITYYNANNEKMVKENHAAYYKAVTCNRSVKADTYEAMTDCADLNGDVGQQWLALYACFDNRVMQPILADSLKVVTRSAELPAGYTTGIHMFGQKTAFNLNNTNYDWNQSAPGIFVYFQVDEEAVAGTSGSAFTGGWIALAAAAGIALGAVVTAVSMTTMKKKKEGAAAA